uniref:Uncharacterized protein n=1 Tax=Salix viminalis TaxID=40686 RepID=A0A6N2KFR9_SALVM
MGDIHQEETPLTCDKVWDREIILTALKDFHDNDMVLLQEAIERNFSDVRHREHKHSLQMGLQRRQGRCNPSR